ncbi:DUF2835 domain-containing protein [Thiorhodococcus mannitoliphagus]|uniref:DUF2835 domain-containing protein n=1 Tax=Thiorhodococcus mannitoliphagus TaxID=329406 RepID=A0A6P1E0S1_9GAMM|nr:DUF2835 domain-containing protein [Thiorhodococcus mannitoliphagus]NEX22072.1 DUF2835 domain-containing protein [Thiorhodococcus mannitoliphagus]
MQRFYFSLSISASEYLKYYRGTAGRVIVRASDGRSLSIPAVNLRPFVTQEGIRGHFCLTVDQDHKLVSIERHPAAQPRSA